MVKRPGIFTLIALTVFWAVAFGGRALAAAPLPAAAAAEEAAQTSPENIQYRDIAGLSDEEIRERYLKDLENSAAFSGEDAGGGIKGFFSTLLQQLEAFGLKPEV